MQKETNYYRIRDEIFLLQGFVQAIQADMSPTTFKKTLIEHLRKFSIDSCVICLYPAPLFNESGNGCLLPDKAYMFLGYNGDQEWLFDDKPEEFNPYQNIVPPQYFPRECKYRIVLPLFSQQQFYGYAWFTPNNVIDFSFYSILFSMVSGEVMAAFALQDERRHAEELRHFSYTDDLTKAFNRRGFFFYGKRAIDMALEMGQQGMVFFSDLDNLKTINDTYGHEAGNRAIKAQAAILKSAFRATDVVARIGGDEFVAIFVGLSDETAEFMREKIQRLTDDWNKHSGEPFEVSMSVGVVHFDEKRCNLTELLNMADNEQYKEKRQKKLQKADNNRV